MSRRGYTLIELLVVVAMLAALTGAVVLAFPDSGARRAELAAARFQGLLQLACERAELLGRDIGIGIARQRIGFGPIERGRWRPYADSSGEALRPRPLEAAMTWALLRDGREQALPLELPSQPQLACRATGELTPFVLRLDGPGPQRWLLRGDAEGGIVRERDDASP